MKKVMKKFNRALSIMLVAAMVLTMAPQTAMPVLAAETGTEAEITEPQVPDVEPVVEETATGSETEDGEGSEGDNQPPVIESENPPVEETPAEPSEEVIEETPEELPEEVTEEELPADEGQSDTVKTNEIVPNAVTPSAAEVSVDTKSGTDAETATVTWVGGCVDGDKKLATGKDLRFRVALNSGRSLTKVEAQIGETGEGKTPTTKDLTASGANADTIYTVAWADIKKTVDGKDVGQPVKIVVTTAAQTYDITFAKSASGLAESTFSIYPVKNKSAEDTTKVLDAELTGKKVEGAAFNDEKLYAIKVAAAANKLVKVTVNGENVTVGETEIETTAAAGETPAVTEKVPTVSLKTSDYVKAGDTGFTVEVEVAAKATLTAEIAENDNITLSSGTAGTDVIAYNADDGNFGADIVEGGLKDASKLAFGVKANTNYEITSVTAAAKTDEEIAADAEGTALTVTAGTKDATSGVTPYTVSLTNIKDFTKNMTVTVTVTTAYTEAYAGNHVHTVTFAGDLNKATVTTGSGMDDLPEGNILKVEDNDLQINVTPNEGYALPKRGGENAATKDDSVISVEKTVKYETDTAGTYGTAVKQTELLKVDAATEAATLTLVGADKNYEGGDAVDATDKNFIVVSATVTINTVVEANDADKQLEIDNQLEGAEYSVLYAEAEGEFKEASLDETLTAEDVTDEEELDHIYYIPKAAARVKVTVDTDKTPLVSLGGSDLTKEEGDGYNYIFPAKNLTDGIVNILSITDAPADPDEDAAVKVKLDTKDVTLTAYKVGDDSKSTSLGVADAYGYAALADAVVGKSLSLTFTQVEGATLKSVSYKMGETTGSVTPSREGVATLEIEEVTGAVTIDVESESKYVVKLYDSNDDELGQDKDGVYEADYKETGIQIKLFKTQSKKDDVPFYDVIVKDGNATAETSATVAADGLSAELSAIHKDERGKVLTVEVYEKDKEEPYIAKLRTNASSSEVKVSRVVNGKATAVAKDTTVEMPLDAQMTFKVESVGASVSDLGVKLFKEDGTAAIDATTQAWFDHSGTVTLDSDGTFTITTTASKDARGKVEVRIFNKNEEVTAGQTEKALEGGTFKLDVKGYMADNDVTGITAAPGTTSNTTVRINLNTTFKDKKNLPAHPETGDLYYKVVLDEITVDTANPLPANVTKLTGAELTSYYKITDYVNPAQTVAIDLVKDTRTGAAAADDIVSSMTTNIKEVTLVQSIVSDNLEEKETVTENTDYVASKHSATIKDKDKVLTTKKPLYETKLSVKTVNGAALFTGQPNVKVATPVFGKETGYDELSVQFVDTKTGVLNGEPGTDSNNPAIDADYHFAAWVDPQDNSIYVDATNAYGASSYKTLGLKVTATYPQTDIGDGYAATAVVKLNIKQGIYAIEADESKAKLPETIFVVPGNKGKAGSAKITPLYNYGYKEAKPAKAAVTWAIESGYNGNANIQKNLNAVNAKGKAAPTITVKNGTVTVSKDYQFGKTAADNTFTVTARAADFAGNGDADGNDVCANFTFVITDEQDKLEAGSIVIVEEVYQSGYKYVVKDASSLKAEDFDVDLYVGALRNGVKKGKESYTASDFMPVTITSGSKANLEVGAIENNLAPLTFKKPGTKLKINVNTVDGGKGSRDVKVKDSLIVNIAPYENLGLYFAGADGSWYTPDNTETIKYAGGSNQMYTLKLQHKHTVGNHAGDWWDDDQYKNVKVTVKGGKFIANKYWAKNINEYKYPQDYCDMGTAVVVTDKSGKATVTVTDTANPNKATNHKDYVIENTSVNEASQKAPSIKLYSPKKITNEALWNRDDGGYTNPIVYQVTDKTKDNYAGQYVKISPDYTAANNMAEYLDREWDEDSSQYVKDGIITVAKIDENGRFEMYPNHSLSGGSYKMVATVCEMKRGEILPLAKDVKLNFSIPKPKKANTSLNVTAKYTLDAKSSSTVTIGVKSDYMYQISEAKNVIKNAKDQVLNKDGHTNEFTRYFEVTGVGSNYYGDPQYYTIGLKDNLSAEQLKYITGNGETKELQKKAKEDCVGYITVSNGYYYDYDQDGTDEFNAYNTKDVKVTVSFKENKYSVTGASVFPPKDNAPITVSVSLMNGKTKVPVVAAALDTTDSKSFAASAKAGRSAIEITSNATAEAKKHDVVLKVVPANSGYIKTATWNSTTNKWDLTYVSKDGTANYASEEELIAACGVTVTAKIEVKATDAKKVLKTKNLNVALNADNYVEAATRGNMGEYVAYVPYEFVAGNTDISAVALAKDAKSGKDLNEVATKTLVTVAAKDGNFPIYDNNGNHCIKISINKAVLKEQAEKYAANKKAADVVTNYGAKLKVPVTFTYTNNGTTTETVTFNVTMPKKAMTFDEVKDILDGTATVGSGKNARNIKDEIEKIRTPQQEHSNRILKGLLAKVWTKVNSEIPKDADVKLAPDWSNLEWWNEDDATEITKAQLNDGKSATPADDGADYDGIMTAGKAVVTLTLTNWAAADGTANVPYTFGADMLGVKHRYGSDGTAVETDVVSAIQSFLDGASFVATNDLEADDLLAAIWKLDGVKEYNSDRDSVHIWIKDFNKTEATERKAGSLTVEICVNDEANSASKTKTIDRINNIGDAQTALSTALSGSNVLAIVDDCSGIEAKIEAKILADAKKAIGNENITVNWAQRVKTPATGSTPAVMEDDFTYEAPKAATTGDNAADAVDGSIAFALEAKSKSGRAVKYTLAATTVPKAKADLYFDTADKAKAAIMKAVVTSGEEETEAYDLLKATLTGVGNTQAAIEAAVETAFENLSATVLGWTAEDVTVTYTPAEPNDGETAKPGKVTITANIVLTGDPTVKSELKVENAPVVDWDDTFQTAAQLKTAITAEAAKAIEVNAAANIPAADETGIASAKTALEGKFDTLVTGEGLAVAYVYDDATTPAAYSKDDTANTAKFENVKINISKDGDVVDSVTVTVNWKVKEAAPSPASGA